MPRLIRSLSGFDSSDYCGSDSRSVDVSGATCGIHGGLCRFVCGSGNAIVVGCYGDDTRSTDAGAAVLFSRTGSSRSCILVLALCGFSAASSSWSATGLVFYASDAAAGDWFGYSVAVCGEFFSFLCSARFCLLVCLFSLV